MFHIICVVGEGIFEVGVCLAWIGKKDMVVIVPLLEQKSNILSYIP